MLRNLICLLVVALFIMPKAFAASVSKVKGAGVLVSLEGESPTPGDMYYAIDADGKKRGIIEITKVKGDKALGKLIKGRAEVGMTLQVRTGSQAVGKNGGKGGGSADHPTGRSYWGVMGGYAMDSMNAQVNNLANVPIGNVSMSGSGFSIMGLFDYEVFPQVWIRALGGLEAFNATGPTQCSGLTAACTAQIDYLAVDFLARYAFTDGMMRPWVGAGLGLMFPASKSSTALSSDSIGTTNVLIGAGGLDLFVNPTFFIPFSLEYGLLPKSSQVSAQWIEFRVGFGIPF